jgi:glycerol-3-phosphate dehydrogenase (NAD(P)+)
MSEHTTVSVIGGGLWGRALAAAAARAGNEVRLISRREGEPIAGVTAETDLKKAAESRLLVLAVPSAHVQEITRQLGAHLDGGHFLLHGVRGLVGPQLQTLAEVVQSRTAVRRIGALGGPVLVDELLRGDPSVMVVGSHFGEVLDLSRIAFEHPTLRLYTTRDRVGLEWASALTGVLAIAVGFASSTGLGPGVVAAFTTRAVHEASRIAVAAGGENSTLIGLAGLGDLLAAVAQEGRPEVMLGRSFARGESLDVIRARAGQHIEALDLLPPLAAWVTRHKVRAPIILAIVDALFHQHPRDELVHRLMTTPVEDSG